MYPMSDRPGLPRSSDPVGRDALYIWIRRGAPLNSRVLTDQLLLVELPPSHLLAKMTAPKGTGYYRPQL
jgi:hypothetical protein